MYDHLVRMQEITESMRDLVSGTLDTYLSVVNNRMNDIMKTLTIITTLFMPISFIASIFWDELFSACYAVGCLDWAPAFVITLLITILTTVGILLWIRKRGWMK